jgi:hypothetical protein
VGWLWSGVREHRVVVVSWGGSWGEDMLGGTFSRDRKR